VTCGGIKTVRPMFMPVMNAIIKGRNMVIPDIIYINMETELNRNMIKNIRLNAAFG